MTLIIIASLIVLTAAFGALCHFVRHAADGYEDEAGFHFAPEPLVIRPLDTRRGSADKRVPAIHELSDCTK